MAKAGMRSQRRKTAGASLDEIDGSNMMSKTWDSLHMGRSSIDLYSNDIGSAFHRDRQLRGICRRFAHQYQRGRAGGWD